MPLDFLETCVQGPRPMRERERLCWCVRASMANEGERWNRRRAREKGVGVCVFSDAGAW